MMVNVYGKIRGTEDTDSIVIATFETEKQAETFCEQWGWIYDDGSNRYSLSY